MWYKIQKCIGVAIVVCVVVFVCYGLKVDCPNTAGFVSCAYKFNKD
jgi:hypothetical protein